MKKPKYVGTIIIIAINIVIYCVTCYNMKYIVEFGLNLQDIRSNFEIYRIFTFMFINDLRGIILTTMFFSYFGKEFEKKHGAGAILSNYILIGIASGVILALGKGEIFRTQMDFETIRNIPIIAGSIVPITGMIGYQLGEGKNSIRFKVVVIIYLLFSYVFYWKGTYIIRILAMIKTVFTGFLLQRLEEYFISRRLKKNK